MRASVERLRASAEAEGRQCLAAAVILDSLGRAFVPRRSENSALLPGIWDLVGGHVEREESVLEALGREIQEETGWRVRGTPLFLYVADWEAQGEGGVLRKYREFDFVVEVVGDLDAPRLAAGEHVDYRWVGVDDLQLLEDNRHLDRGMVRHVVEAGLRCARREELAFPHVTLFVPPSAAAPVEFLRRTWDPVMAAQIAAHVTVAYPRELGALGDVASRVRAAAAEVRRFRMRFGDAVHDGDPRRGVFFEVDDLDGGWQQLRELVVGKGHEAVPPHVTVVHPRTSNLGPAAWSKLQTRRQPAVFTVNTVAVTAFDGRTWPRLLDQPLSG